MIETGIATVFSRTSRRQIETGIAPAFSRTSRRLFESGITVATEKVRLMLKVVFILLNELS